MYDTPATPYLHSAPYFPSQTFCTNSGALGLAQQCPLITERATHVLCPFVPHLLTVCRIGRHAQYLPRPQPVAVEPRVERLQSHNVNAVLARQQATRVTRHDRVVGARTTPASTAAIAVTAVDSGGRRGACTHMHRVRWEVVARGALRARIRLQNIHGYSRLSPRPRLAVRLYATLKCLAQASSAPHDVPRYVQGQLGAHVPLRTTCLPQQPTALRSDARPAEHRAHHQHQKQGRQQRNGTKRTSVCAAPRQHRACCCPQQYHSHYRMKRGCLVTQISTVA